MDFEGLQKYVRDWLEKSLPRELEYHAIDHTFDVLNAVEEIALAEGVSEKELLLLKTAALLHDCGFVKKYRDNEIIASELSSKLLPKYNYSKEDIQIIQNMIMATAVPQHPKTKLEEILCDADLDYLGRSDFDELSTKLRHELNAYNYQMSDLEWYELEVNFLKNHKYFTDYSKKEREPEKEKRIEELIKKIKV